jgi:phenylacetate-CoA ligase
MAGIQSSLYLALQTLLRLTVRRADWFELQFQKKMRKADLETLHRYSHQQAVAYANRMAEVSPAYRAKLDEAGIRLPIDNSPEAWLNLPLLSKQDYQNESVPWVNQQLDSATLLWSSTSGSSGQPFRFPQDAETQRADVAAHELNLLSVGWRPGFREALFKVEERRITGMSGILRRLMGTMPVTFSAAKFGPNYAADIIEQLQKRRIQYLWGYSSSLVFMAEEVLKRGANCSIPIITTLREGLTEAQAKTVESAFHGKIYRDYSASEAMHIGCECALQDGYHLDLSRLRIEVLDGDRPAKPGESGEIVITHFRNHSMPFVRYRTGDVGVLSETDYKCGCGCTYPKLKSIEGRVGDVILAPNGAYLNVQFFVVIFEYLYQYIAQFKVVQTKPDELEITCVTRGDQAANQLSVPEKQIAEITEGTMRVKWKIVSEIPADPSGKRKLVVPLKTGNSGLVGTVS